MSPFPTCIVIILALICLLATSSASLADAPPANTIPIIAERPTFEDITLELLCTLSWMHFDAVNRYGYEPAELMEKLVEPAEEVGLYVILSPGAIELWKNNWARISLYELDHDSAYARPGWYDPNISSCSGDTLLESKRASEMQSSLETTASDLATYFKIQDNVWFYLCFDEAPARQWNRMVNDSAKVNDSTYVACFFDDYMPNMFTQAMDSVYRSDYSAPGIYWLPTLEEVEPTGMLSWLKWELEEDTTSYHPMTITFSSMHTMVDWAGASNLFEETGFNPSSYSDQATAVRSYLNMEYQGWDDSILDAVENFPEFFALDAYPFRIVGIEYQTDSSYTPSLGDSLELWIFEHYVEAMDSTFIPAREIAVERGTDIPIIYWPQGFGRVGGNAMWAYDDSLSKYILDYESCSYRYPTPQEFLMNCNIALLRGAKSLQPFCLATYDQPEYSVLAGHLDRNHVPFDAPYEEWVYRDRPISDTLQYISPDLIPPFMDGYDPLYDLDDRPILPADDSAREVFRTWKFEPYGRLWNSMRKTFAQIARIAPELATLWWWEDYEDEASIEYDGTEPDPFYTPHIKVFTDSTESDCYLFYVNRYCRANDNPFEIVYNTVDLPGGIDHSDRVLDHSRRFVMDGIQSPRGVFTFLDTLDAGQARLVQLFDPDSGLAADIRITSPDVWTIEPYTDDTTSVLRNIHGETLDIIARFYNMGTGSADSVEVTAYDLTDSAVVGDTDYLYFDGLPTDSGSCRQTDADDVIFSWDTRSASIGPHIIRIRAEGIQSEPDTLDNTVLVTFLLDPMDYATEVLENPWDMTEATSHIPDWYTNDIEDVSTWWDTSSGWTDSVSGMFEGVLDEDISGNLFRGDISLSIPEDSTIDVDDYYRLSLATVCMNPNGNATTAAGCELHLWWIDSHGDTLTANLGPEIGAIRNGTDQWQEYGPIDLRLVTGLGWNNKEASEVWFSFRTSKPDAPEIPKPVDIRLGWVRLTE